jgi:hypothetical protein
MQRGAYRRPGDVLNRAINTCLRLVGYFGFKPTFDLSCRYDITRRSVLLQSSFVPPLEGTFAGALFLVYEMLLFAYRAHTGVTLPVWSIGASDVLS